MLINYLVKEIVLFDDAIHIYYNSPLMISPDESQGFSFCDRNAQIPVHIQNCLETRSKTIRLTMNI